MGKVLPTDGRLIQEMLDSQGFDFYDIATVLDDPRFCHVVITSEQMVFVIPFGHSLTSFEKFMSPFDATTWLLIVTTAVASFVGIQIFKFTSRQLRDLFFGDKIGSPSMNLWNVFLCGGQAKVPKSVNARFVLLNFLIWSLIIRTCFQSLMYRALQMDLRQPPMKTLKDLRENDFKQFAMHPDLEKVDKNQLREDYYE